MPSSPGVRYHPLFECDVRDAAAWYDRRSSGLGDAFKDLVRRAVEQVIPRPHDFAHMANGIRYVRVERFPYVVLYDSAEAETIFLGVLHTARSMEKWRERRSP